MNERAVSVLENYEAEVISTQKSRNAILCEISGGWAVLREYRGPKNRLSTQKKLLSSIRENGFLLVEQLYETKDGELFTLDQEQTPCILKSWFMGRECSTRDEKECRRAVGELARLHKAMCLPELSAEANLTPVSLISEYEKRNRELKKVRKYLRDKGQKNIFEICLQQNFDGFFEKAQQILEDMKEYHYIFDGESAKKEGTFCHGDFNQHNFLNMPEGFAAVNFEKYVLDSQMRDLYTFLRKLLEKNHWANAFGKSLLEAYEKEKSLSAYDRIQLYYRFAYPEKFWKIVNFYYNNAKSWIPEKNLEKLAAVIEQESIKNDFLEDIFSL